MALIGIGIDSGGTHTTCAVMTGDGRDSVAMTESSSTISDARGAVSTRRAAEWIVSRVLGLTQPGDETCVWIGASAQVSGASASLFEEAFEAPLRQLSDRGRDCEIFIANDAISILKSPPLLSRGVAAIIGTGSIVVGVHPACPDGVIRRGGYEWPVGDEGAGIWMTFECVRLLLDDIQHRGSNGYHSSLLDRLCDYFGVDPSTFDSIADSHSALVRAELLAAMLAQAGDNAKRRIAGFVHPNLFDLATISGGAAHDPIAARVISRSVRIMVSDIGAVSETLAAFTADNPNSRERLPVVVGGSIAANPIYQQQLAAAISECAYLKPLEVLGDAAETFAMLAMHYLRSDFRERRIIARGFDPIHQVQRLL